MYLLLTALKNLGWLPYFGYPSTPEKCERQESKGTSWGVHHNEMAVEKVCRQRQILAVH